MTHPDDEKAANSYMASVHMLDFLEKLSPEVRGHLEIDIKHAFLAGIQHARSQMREKLREAFEAGREDFVEKELKGLLKAARELAPFDPTEASLDNEWKYTISDLIEKAK